MEAGSSLSAPSFFERHDVDLALLQFWALGLANIGILFGVAPGEIFLSLGLVLLLFGKTISAKLRLAGRESQPGGIQAPFPVLILALYVAWTFVSLFFSPSPIGIPQLGAVRKMFIYLVLPAAYTAFRRGDQHRVLKWTLIASAIAGVMSLVEFFGFFYPALHDAKDFYSSYSQARIIGFMGHWMTFSGQQMLAMSMLFALLLYARKRAWWMWLSGGLVALSLLFSLTRNTWLGCIAAAFYLLWPFGRRWMLAVPVVIAIFVLVAPPLFRERITSITNLRSDSSNQARVLMLRTGRRIIEAHPLVGVGPNGVEYAFNTYRPAGPIPRGWYGHLHNDYLQIAAERGLPALAIFLWFMIAVLRGLRSIAARVPVDRRYIAHGAAAAVVAIAVSGCFEYNFSDSEVAILLFFFIAHGYAAGAGTEPEPVVIEAAAKIA